MKYNINRKESIENAVELILNGKVIIYPTDTLYGFGVDAINNEAIKKLNILKKRNQPYSIIVSSINMLKTYCDFNLQLHNFIDKIFPGPFTLIMNKKNNILPSLLTNNLDTIGIRMPNSKFIIDVINKINRPIVTTCVNIHNQKSLNSISEIESEFSNINFFYNSLYKNSKGSTIVDCTKFPYKIIRQGDGAVTL